MKKIKLSQAWIARVTSGLDEEDAIVASGHDLEPAPSDQEVIAVVRAAAGTDAVREMVRRKWFVTASEKGETGRADALFDFLFSIPSHRATLNAAAMFRRQARQRDLVDEMGTLAWLCRVTDKAKSVAVRSSFDKTKLNDKAISHLARLSVNEDGPAVAIDYLRRMGVTVVLENALPGMRTDGVSFVTKEQGPVIGLTLRYDRLDSFWFTLMHEVAHIVLHLADRPNEVFVDSFDEDDNEEIEVEAEANAFAKDAFVPRDTWLRSDAFRFGTEAAVVALADKCSIHPAIVAGRVRFEKKKFHAFQTLLGAGQIRATLLAE